MGLHGPRRVERLPPVTAEFALLDIAGTRVSLRRATRSDVAAIVGLIADDRVGRSRDGGDGDLGPYLEAFEAIETDRAQLLLVAEHDGEVVATMQLTFIPGMAHRGAMRAQVEAVRVRQDYRGRGLGASMMHWAIAESEQRGCALVQLTSHSSRTEAHRFYGRLGFTASHMGFKLPLPRRTP